MPDLKHISDEEILEKYFKYLGTEVYPEIYDCCFPLDWDCDILMNIVASLGIEYRRVDPRFYVYSLYEEQTHITFTDYIYSKDGAVNLARMYLMVTEEDSDV